MEQKNEGQGFQRPKCIVKAKKLKKIKFLLIKKIIYWNNALILSYKNFLFSSFFWPSSHFLAFKIFGLHFSAPFWVRGGLKSFSGHYKSTFRNIYNLRCKKATVIAGAAVLEEFFKPPLTQNGAEKWRQRILKAKMCDQGQKIEENWKFI